MQLSQMAPMVQSQVPERAAAAWRRYVHGLSYDAWANLEYGGSAYWYSYASHLILLQLQRIETIWQGKWYGCSSTPVFLQHSSGMHSSSSLSRMATAIDMLYSQL